MKHPVEDRYMGIREFGISDREIFENIKPYENNSNSKSDVFGDVGELEEELELIGAEE